MADPPPAHHCKDCGLVFDSGKSLDVHLHYHKENLLSKWAQQGGEESNNNHVHHKKPANNRTPHPPPSAATPDSSDNRGGGGYYQPQTNYLPAQQTPDEQGFILGTGSSFPLITRTPTPNSSSSPSPHSNNSSYHRYHPYQHAPYPSPSPDHHRNGLVSSSSPQQCDKCGFICESAVQLIEHNALAHSNNHVIDHQHHNNMFQIKAEPSQAEILDLDSHKVHVYQPPQRPPQPNMEQDRSVSALMSWVNDTNKEQHRFHQQSGLASPDCYGGAVSTTTLTPPEPDPISRHRPPDNNSYHAYEQQQQQHLQQQQANNQQQISSSQLPPAPAQQQQQPQQQSTGGGKSKSGSGGSWKSNEARRPKTYNCSACNKWFTSSGHLKRHYNTTLHKNAVKSSGVPDPASMPISVHHHPQKEAPAAFNQPPTSPPEPPSPQPVDELPPQPPAPPPPPLQPIPPPPSSHHLNHLNHLNHFLPSPPNLMAGSSEVTGGLLLHTTPYHQELLSQQQHQLQQHSSSMQGEPPPTYHLAFSPHQPQPGSQLTTFTSPPPSQAATANPNFQPPHVSTIGQLVTTTSSISGNNLADIHMYLTDKTHRDDSADNIKPLPSFSQQFVNHFVSLPQVTSSQSNHVGGPTYHFDPSFGGPSVFDDNLFYTQQLQATLKAEADFVEEAGAEEQQQSVQSPVDEFPTSTQASPNAMFNHEVEHIVMKSDTKSNPSLYEMMLEEDAVVKSEETVSSTIESSPISETRVVRGKEEKIYRCEDCDKIFNKVCYLTQHNKSFHAGNKPYKCERCGKRFLGEDERQAHASKHAGDKPYKCEMCPKQFNHKTDLRRHMCLHTGDKPFACEQCGKGFIRKDHMLKHCETHKKRSSRTQPPGQASPQVQAKKQLKMKLGHGSKLTAQPNPPPLAAMQLVM